MNRKNFFSSLVPLSFSLTHFPFLNGVSGNDEDYEQATRGKIPPYLKTGDLIGITCPSGYISFSETLPAMRKLEEWGFRVCTGTTVGSKDFTFAGSDEERAKDLQVMLDNPSIKAIMFGRGGYGAVRIIDKINFKRFAGNPKWIMGFSDATVFHSHINRNFGIPTIHSKMCNSFPDDWSLAEPGQIDSIESIRKCLTGNKMKYNAVTDERNRNGVGEGELVGGNLSILESLAGSRSALNTSGKILFVEDTGEYLYNIDRMMWNIKRSGMLHKIRGLIVGSFTHIKPDDPGEEFGKTIQDIVLEKVKEFDYPVCFNFPVGHQKVNYALKCGILHRINVTDQFVSLLEI
jgi:muramoyltetrapeptide carboxypeptidase